MARLEDAVREAEGGIALSLEVQPGAKQPAFPAGFNAWRGRIQARVQAQAEDGQANAALLGMVADFFRVPAARVELAQGAAQRQKVVIVHGLLREQALGRLRASLEARA